MQTEAVGSSKRHVDAVCFGPPGAAPEGRQLLVGCSNLNGNVWDGEVQLWGHTAKGWQKRGASVTPYGVSDVDWVSRELFVFGMDNGEAFINTLASLHPPKHKGGKSARGGKKQKEEGNNNEEEEEEEDNDDDGFRRLDKHMGGVVRVRTNPVVRSSVLTGGQDGLLCVWDVELAIPTPFYGHVTAVDDVCWHPTFPNIFLSCSSFQGGGVKVWDVRNSTPSQELTQVRGGTAVGVVTGQTMAIGTNEGLLQIVDARKPTESLLTDQLDSCVHRLVVTPRGVVCATTAHGTLYARRLEQGREGLQWHLPATTIEAHSDATNGLSVMEGDGGLAVATGAWDHAIKHHTLQL